MGTHTANMGLDIFDLIDVDNNGKLSQKELMAFMAVMFAGCDNDQEKAAVMWLCECFESIAKKNDLDDGDQITAEMFKDFEPSEEMRAKAEELEDAFDEIEKGLKGNEEQVRAMITEANSKSKEEIANFLQEECGL